MGGEGGGGVGRFSLRTVQHVVERAVRVVLREPTVVVTGASRTDAGVHAAGQVAAFTTEPIEGAGVGWPASRGTAALVRALNAKLPRDVLVTGARVVPEGFDPIGWAVRKRYTYVFASGPVRPLFDRRTVFHTWYELDADRMRSAAEVLVGRHDFAGFAAASHGRRSTVRTIFDAAVVELPTGAAAGGLEDGCRRIAVSVEGDGFLYNMVRIIAGTMMEVGRGKMGPDHVARALAEADRRLAGPTLPPQGLRLDWVEHRG